MGKETIPGILPGRKAEYTDKRRVRARNSRQKPEISRLLPRGKGRTSGGQQCFVAGLDKAGEDAVSKWDRATQVVALDP